MIKWTTTTHELVVVGADLTGFDVVVSYRQPTAKVDATPDSVTYDGNDTTITVTLTQRQSGSLRQGKCEVQVNWYDQTARRGATEVVTIDVGDNLIPRVMPHE